MTFAQAAVFPSPVSDNALNLKLEN